MIGAKQPLHEYLFWQFSRKDQTKLALRAGNWKAVWPDTKLPAELYNLSNDIGEEKNLAAQYPDVISKLKNLMVDATK